MNRLIIFVLMALFSSEPALAKTITKRLENHGELEVSPSVEGMTVISVHDDEISDLVQSTFSDFFEISFQNGDVYIRFVGDKGQAALKSHPVSVITKDGLSFNIIFKGFSQSEVQTVIIKPKTQSQSPSNAASRVSSAPVSSRNGDSHSDIVTAAIQEAILSITSDRPPKGRSHMSVYKTIKTSSGFTARIIVLNGGKKGRSIKFDALSSQSGIVALWLDNTALLPGKTYWGISLWQ